MKSDDREDDPRCLPSIGSSSFRAVRRSRFPVNVTEAVRPSVACRGERRASHLSMCCPGCHPPPSPRLLETGHRSCERRRPHSFSGPRRHYRSLQRIKTHGHAPSCRPSSARGCRPCPPDEEPCRLSVFSARPSRGTSVPFGAVGDVAFGDRREKRGAPRLTTGAARASSHRVKEV